METLTIRHFPEEMEQLPVDPENLNRVLLSGLFEEKAKTAEGERPFYTFIPENLEYDQQCLVIAPPAQADIPEFLESSGLRQFAEEKQLFLFFLKAEDGKWDLSGKDAAYMNAVYVAAQARDHYITMQDNFYALGFENGADVAHQAVMTSITENFDGVSIDHLKTLPASVKFITEDGHGVQDNATMARAFAICTQKDITVMSHAEDMEISPWDYRLAEDIETVRNCWLSEYYQTRLHMCHVSTRGALDAIRMAKLRGAPVTCEVTPHHLWFTNDTCDYRVNPPIRTADDVEALVEGIRTGIVDAIATDHAPHSEEDKLKGMAGMVGSETSFGVCYTKLCKQEGLPLELLVHLMSTRPAEILGLAKGQLEPGYDADLVLVDLDTPYSVDKDKLHSKSHNTPFDGAQLYGKVCATIKGGELTYQAEE